VSLAGHKKEQLILIQKQLNIIGMHSLNNEVARLNTSMAMAPRQTSILRFQFEDFIRSCGSSKASGILADSTATDEGGNNWRLILRRGVPPRVSKEHTRVMVAMALVREASSSQFYDEATKFSFIIRDRHGNVAHEEAFLSSQSNEAKSKSSISMNMFVMSSFKVDDRITANGTLTIDVAIQVLTKTKTERSSHCNPFGKNMLNLLQSGARSDVVFKIDDFTVRAHKFILETNAPALARLCDGHDKLNRPVRIFGTSPEAFGHILRYIYGGEAPGADAVLRLGKDLIATSYRFGQTSLKMEVERTLVDCCAVDVSNCIDYILVSDEQQCSFLKNHAISYLVTRSHDVLNSESSGKLKENPRLMREIMAAMADNSKHAGSSSVQKQTIWGRIWGARKGRKNNSTKQKEVVRHEKKATTKVRQVSASGSVLSVYKRAVKGNEGHSVLDPEKIRREAKQLLEAAEFGSLQKPRSHYKRMHGNNGWIVSP